MNTGEWEAQDNYRWVQRVEPDGRKHNVRQQEWLHYPEPPLGLVDKVEWRDTPEEETS
jgi:hypothetical protein